MVNNCRTALHLQNQRTGATTCQLLGAQCAEAEHQRDQRQHVHSY